MKKIKCEVTDMINRFSYSPIIHTGAVVNVIPLQQRPTRSFFC